MPQEPNQRLFEKLLSLLATVVVEYPVEDFPDRLAERLDLGAAIRIDLSLNYDAVRVHKQKETHLVAPALLQVSGQVVSSEEQLGLFAHRVRPYFPVRILGEGLRSEELSEFSQQRLPENILLEMVGPGRDFQFFLRH